MYTATPILTAEVIGGPEDGAFVEIRKSPESFHRHVAIETDERGIYSKYELAEDGNLYYSNMQVVGRN